MKQLDQKNKILQTFELTVLPKFNISESLEDLNLLKEKISLGTYSTIQFYLIDITKRLGRIYKYETCPRLRKDIEEVVNILTEFKYGNDNLVEKTGEFRRGFLSDIDSTYQPYTIKVPEDYDAKKKYPLLVFLHGSGRTDKYMFRFHPYLSEGNVIQIAPKARGTSNYYVTKEAQIDIEEAINDVIKIYNIDTTKIILSGFSMGGYGVYRTYYETPNRYTALAVFSGEPKVNFLYKTFNRVKGGKYINFLKKKSLKDFNDIPIFIYHGTKDLNCPYKYTDKIANKLKSINSDVTFISDDDGHGLSKNNQSLNKYYKWLNMQLNK